MDPKKIRNMRHRQRIKQQNQQHYENYVNDLKKVLNNEYQGKSVYAGVLNSRLLKAKSGTEFDSILNKFRQEVIIPHLLNVQPSAKTSSRLGLMDQNEALVYGYVSDFRQDHRRGHVGSLLIDNPRVMIKGAYDAMKASDRLLDSHLWVKADKITPILDPADIRGIGISGIKLTIGIGDLIVLCGEPVAYRSHAADGKPIYKWKLRDRSLVMPNCGQLVAGKITDHLTQKHFSIISGYDHDDDWVIKFDHLPNKDHPYCKITTQKSNYPSYKDRFNIKD